MTQTLLKQILETSVRIKNDRDPRDVLMTIVEEVGELATEIAITTGHKKRDASDDGVLGEAIDVIIAAADIIHLILGKELEFDTETIERIVMDRAKLKLEKWENGV